VAVPQKFAPGTVIEGPVTSITKFGAFVQLTEGVEGMIHVSEISAEKRINHPQDVLRVGQIVKAQVLALDAEKRLIRLSMKQLVPTGLDEYLADHKEGDTVTGRITEISGGTARVELGEGRVRDLPSSGGRLEEGERREEPGAAGFVQARFVVARINAPGTLEKWPSRQRSGTRFPAFGRGPRIPHRETRRGEKEIDLELK